MTLPGDGDVNNGFVAAPAQGCRHERQCQEQHTALTLLPHFPKKVTIMKILTSSTGKTAVAVALGALLTSGAFAQSPAPLPPVQTSGATEFLSGGVGQNESAAIEKASRQWPLTLEFAVKGKDHNDFVANVKVLVRDTKGHTLLQTTANGPFLLARLAPGRYTVEATLAGKTLHESVAVKTGQPARTVLIWPAGTDETSS